MLADLLPLMTDTVGHRRFPTRNIVGRTVDAYITSHRARIVYSPGQSVGTASRQSVPDAAATVWLINHPHPITIGDTFELSDDAVLKVVRVERRSLPDGTIHKAYLT
jgi:hypothetical protein